MMCASSSRFSSLAVLLDGIISNGFQLVSSAGTPKLLPDQTLVTMEAAFNGVGESGETERERWHLFSAGVWR